MEKELKHIILDMFYPVRNPFWVKYLLRGVTWNGSNRDGVVYLTFDDGPHPEVTPFVLEELNKFNAKATFFCIGKNVQEYPELYKRIIEEGHAVGNHTQNHVNYKKIGEKAFLKDVSEAQKIIDSSLFRPPYGKINNFLVRQLSAPGYGLKTIMWSVLSGDFDLNLQPQKCLEHVLLNTRAGDIVVFHDSEKAKPRLGFALPLALKYWKERDFVFEKLT